MSIKDLSRSKKAAGLITVIAMLLAFAVANSPANEWYQVVHHLPVMVQVGTFAIDKPLILWINDGLMVFFFLLIALELKREILEGQLSTPLAIATPGFAALGGMAAPTGVDLYRVQRRRPARHAGLGDPYCYGYRAGVDGALIARHPGADVAQGFSHGAGDIRRFGGNLGYRTVLHRAACYFVSAGGRLRGRRTYRT